jgi:hypothetical protein
MQLTKGGLEAVGLEHIQNVICVNVRSIVVSHRELPGVHARIDTFSTIRDIAILGSSNVASGASSRKLVCISTRSVVEETVGCHAIVVALSTYKWSVQVHTLELVETHSIRLENNSILPHR